MQLSTIAVLALIGTGVLSIGLTMQGAVAAKSSASNGIETADNSVHENTGAVSPQDVRFHEGLCQAGITTEAVWKKNFTAYILQLQEFSLSGSFSENQVHSKMDKRFAFDEFTA